MHAPSDFDESERTELSRYASGTTALLEHTVDDSCGLDRHLSQLRNWNLRAAPPWIVVGIFCYSSSPLSLFSPIFFSNAMEEEWFPDSQPEAVKQRSALASMLLFACWGPGSFIFSALSDAYGRKPLAYAALSATAAFGALTAISPSFYIYALLRALLGFSIGGLTVGYVLVVEWLTPAENSRVTLVLNVGYCAFTLIFIAVAAAGDALSLGWRTQQAAVAAVLALPLCLVGAALESPRFLLAKGKTKRAEEVLRVALGRSQVALPAGPLLDPISQLEHSSTCHPDSVSGACRSDLLSGASAVDFVNGASAPIEARDALVGRSTRLARSACARLLASPPLLWRLALVSAAWFTVTLLYYGLSFAAGNCEGASCNVYLNLASTSVMDVPGTFVGYFLADHPRFGRRRTLSIGLGFGGVSLLLTPLAQRVFGAPAGMPFSLFGKACSMAAFQVAYIYPTELFPTQSRGTALGVANVFGRIGNVLAPIAGALDPLVCQLLLGALGTVCGVLTLMLPETHGRAMDAPGAVGGARQNGSCLA